MCKILTALPLKDISKRFSKKVITILKDQDCDWAAEIIQWFGCLACMLTTEIQSSALHRSPERCQGSLLSKESIRTNP